MKIALVSAYSWTTPGGANAHIQGLAGQLRAHGHEVRILAPADGAVDAGVIALGRTFGVSFNGSVARLAFGPRVAGRVRVALRRAGPDIVHVHEPFAPSTSMLAAMFARAPVVATFHAAIDSRLYRVAGVPLKPLWNKIAAKIAVSAAARDAVEAVFAPGARIIPNGVDISRYALIPPVDPATKTILFMGRLERRKGPHVLVEAIPDLLREHPNARIVFAGDGPARADLEASIQRQHCEAVSFTGRFDEADRTALLTAASVVCLPATGGESFGYTLVEAMASGRPVVASSIPGYAAIARDGVDGLLVPSGDAPAVAAALGRVLRDPDGVRRMGAEARKRSERYDWPVVGGEIEAVYREVLGRL